MKEDLRIKSKTSIEKTGNIETEATELPRENKIDFPTWVAFETMFKTMFKDMFETMFKTMFKTIFKTTFKTMFEKIKISLI